MLKFLKYQFVIRIISSELLINWVNETKFLVTKGEFGLTGNLYCGFTEYKEMSFLLHFSNQSDTFYDIGANVGSYTILASGVNKAKSICFEPVPSTYKRLLDQIKINKLEHLVISKNNGVGKKFEELDFTSDLNSENKVNTNPSNTNITKVNMVTLDSLDEPKNTTIIKIDVEGYEKFVLEGGINFFKNPYVIAIIIELNGNGSAFNVSDLEVHKMITSFDFKPIDYDPFKRKIILIDAYSDNGLFPNNFSNNIKKGNIIYVKILKMLKIEFWHLHHFGSKQQII